MQGWIGDDCLSLTVRGAGTENEAATSSKNNPAAGGAGGGVFNGRLAEEVKFLDRAERRNQDDTPKKKMVRALLPNIINALIQSRCCAFIHSHARWQSSIMPTRQDARRWSARLTRSIELRDGTELDTLADAANFILALPEHYQDRNSWKRATELLLQAAEQDGDIEAATEQFERALFLEARYVRR